MVILPVLMMVIPGVVMAILHGFILILPVVHGGLPEGHGDPSWGSGCTFLVVHGDPSWVHGVTSWVVMGSFIGGGGGGTHLGGLTLPPTPPPET